MFLEYLRVWSDDGMTKKYPEINCTKYNPYRTCS